MWRFQFSIKQLLIAVAVAAAGLLVVRSALRTQGIAVAVVCLAVAACVLLLIQMLVSLFISVVGAVFVREGGDEHNATGSGMSQAFDHREQS